MNFNAARVKDEVLGQLPQFCYACFSVDRRLYDVGELLEVLNNLFENSGTELVFKSALLCFECRAILRRVSDFKRNVSAVLEFFCNYQCDQRLPPPLSRLGVVNTSDEICVEHEVKLEQEVQEDSQLKEEIDFEEIEFLKDEFTDGDSDEDYWQNVDHSRKPSPKPALLVELDQRSSTSMQPASPQTEEDAPAQTENWNNTLTKRKRTEHKYIRLTERSFCLDKLVTRFSVNHVELERLFEKDRQDELFLALPYRCEACVCGWRLKKNLDLHNDNRHSESAGPYQCDICTRRMGLNRICLHVKTHYVARKCNMCDYKTATQSSMRRHILKNHNKTVECQTCGAFLRSTRDFYYHYRTLHRRFICDHCGQSCLTRDAIKKHLTVHGPYICCGRQFRSYRAFKDHEAYHTKAQPDLCYCVECDKQFKNVLRFRKHLKTAKAHRDSSKQIAPREKVPCPECGKVYARAHTMRNHFNLEHLRRSKYKCEECDLYLRDSAMYRRHMLVNHKPGWEAPRDKICPECGRGFTRNEILKRHIRMHTGERPYKCVLCDAAFTQSSGLQKHVKHIHFKEKRKQAKIKKIKVKKP